MSSSNFRCSSCWKMPRTGGHVPPRSSRPRSRRLADQPSVACYLDTGDKPPYPSSRCIWRPRRGSARAARRAPMSGRQAPKQAKRRLKGGAVPSCSRSDAEVQELVAFASRPVTEAVAPSSRSTLFTDRTTRPKVPKYIVTESASRSLRFTEPQREKEMQREKKQRRPFLENAPKYYTPSEEEVVVRAEMVSSIGSCSAGRASRTV